MLSEDSEQNSEYSTRTRVLSTVIPVVLLLLPVLL